LKELDEPLLGGVGGDEGLVAVQEAAVAGPRAYGLAREGARGSQCWTALRLG